MEIVDNTYQPDRVPVVDRPIRLGVFAKQPIPGEVKTRLCPPLTAVEAAELYLCLQRETITSMVTAGFSVVVFYAGKADYFATEFPGLPLVPQGSGGLGERMERALKLLLEESEAAALIGTDSPDLPPALVREAFAALAEDAFVTIPAQDGGYVLVGESQHEPGMFQDIPWSTNEVLANTRSHAQQLGISYQEVGHWEDVDDWSSLQSLLLRSPQSVTAGLVRSRWLNLLR